MDIEDLNRLKLIGRRRPSFWRRIRCWLRGTVALEEVTVIDFENKTMTIDFGERPR
jgi:hypothetical protein